MLLFIKFIVAVVFVEAVTQILTKSEIFKPVRSFIFDRSHNSSFFKWLHDLLDCGYCTSVWVGWLAYFLILFNSIIITTIYTDWFIIGLVLHRFSNVLHFLIDRVNPS